ncbi:MAG TPA: class I SAM-dependent methyltransferase [Phycisphaerales bacterium]|nr:class I SAM-dependent methyltransferase [Phycisphaerales bacterium]HRQ76381.1 class I SAM-dependent methyltransferase [Phycisphaerales bacterium]
MGTALPPIATSSTGNTHMMDLREITERSQADREYYRRIAEQYFQRHEQPIQQYSTRVEEKWLRELVKPGSQVLLVGIGGGREIRALRELDCEITALDYSREMLEAGRSHWGDHRIEWVLCDAHDLSAYRDRYDAVISLAAINYFVDLPRAMREMSSALVQGGRLMVSSINSLHRSERNVRKPSPSAKVTRYLYSPAQLRTLAQEAGITVETVRGLRYLADLLPVAWNKPGAGPLQRISLSAALWLEPVLQSFLPPDRAKFIWLVASR